MPIAIQSKSDLEQYTQKNGLVVIDFWAVWCGPCGQIAPTFEELSEKYPEAYFLKANSDETEDLSKDHQVTALPSFRFYVHGKRKEEYDIVGVDKELLKKNVGLAYEESLKAPKKE